MRRCLKEISCSACRLDELFPQDVTKKIPFQTLKKVLCATKSCTWVILILNALLWRNKQSYPFITPMKKNLNFCVYTKLFLVEQTCWWSEQLCSAQCWVGSINMTQHGVSLDAVFQDRTRQSCSCFVPVGWINQSFFCDLFFPCRKVEFFVCYLAVMLFGICTPYS